MGRRVTNRNIIHRNTAIFNQDQSNLPDVLNRLKSEVEKKKSEGQSEIDLNTADFASSSALADAVARLDNLESPVHGVSPSDQITATGVATYTVDYDMTHDSPTAYDVSINGLAQDPESDFTIDAEANQITFATPPTAGADIVIIQRDISSFDQQQAINDFLNALNS